MKVSIGEITDENSRKILGDKPPGPGDLDGLNCWSCLRISGSVKIMSLISVVEDGVRIGTCPLLHLKLVIYKWSQVVEEFGLFKFDKVEAGPTKYALHAYQSWKPGLLEEEYAGHVERVSISLGNTRKSDTFSFCEKVEYDVTFALCLVKEHAADARENARLCG